MGVFLIIMTEKYSLLIVSVWNKTLIHRILNYQ